MCSRAFSVRQFSMDCWSRTRSRESGYRQKNAAKRKTKPHVSPEQFEQLLDADSRALRQHGFRGRLDRAPRQ